MKQLVVWWNDRPVGELIQADTGAMEFAYGSEWLEDANTLAISTSLPKVAKHFTQRECHPFFGGLLPEGSQRRLAAKALGISPVNDFAMLGRLGGETAGALQFLPPGRSPIILGSPDNPTPLCDAGLFRLLDSLPTRPMLAGDQNLRLCLAGAQSKLPVTLVSGQVALPLPDQPSTHILKPSVPALDASTENEVLSMRLAAALSLDVAGATPKTLRPPEGKSRTFLLVERYDRKASPHRQLSRLHQEDFCQALGISSERKYQSEGGPSLQQCFSLVRRVSSRPTEDVLKLLDAVIYNAVLGNADAHGKNFSVLYTEAGPVLAPLYDLLCTAIYPELSQKFAMKLGRQSKRERLEVQTWSDFAGHVGLDFQVVRRRICEIADGVVEMATPVSESLTCSGLDDATLERLSAFLIDRARKCLSDIAGR